MPPTTPCRLVIKVDEQHRPEKIIVMAGQHMLASVTIAEVRRVLEQIDELSPHNQTAILSGEHHRSEEETGNE